MTKAIGKNPLFYKTRRTGKVSRFSVTTMKTKMNLLALLLWMATIPQAFAQSAPAPTSKYWTVEDAKERAKLPLYQTIPAARPDELTPANGFPKSETFLNWHRSHGDNGGTRYSALNQINRENITNLQVAWTYHSEDGAVNLQCNPIIVSNVMFTPTPGRFMVAVNAVNGTELWRFKPSGRPAFRGLIYWPGEGDASDRVMFCSGALSQLTSS